MNIDKALEELHKIHGVLLKERDANATTSLKAAIQRNSETIMWLDKYSTESYNPPHSGVGGFPDMSQGMG